MSNNKQTLMERADMSAWNIYSKLVNEVPINILKETVSASYFGNYSILSLIQNRRKRENILHTKENTLAFENNQFFINNAALSDSNLMKNTKALMVPYAEHIKKGLKNVTWSIRNLPYNDAGQSKSKIYPALHNADNMNNVLEFQADVLPTALQRGQDKSLIDLRTKFLNVYGLSKVITNPFNAFSDWGANVATASYICNKGFTGQITVETEKSTYKYDFREKGLIITPGTLPEVDFMFKCLDYDSFDFKGVVLKTGGNKFSREKFPFNGKPVKVRNPEIGSLTKTAKFKFPMIIKLSTSKKNMVYGFTSIIVDESSKFDRVVIPYQTSGYDTGTFKIVTACFVPKGVQLSGSYRYCVVSNKADGEAYANLLMSDFVTYLLSNWRTSVTNDNPQLKIIPKFHNITNLKSNSEYIAAMNGSDIEDIILNG